MEYFNRIRLISSCCERFYNTLYIANYCNAKLLSVNDKK